MVYGEKINWDSKNNPYNFVPFDVPVKEDKEVTGLSSIQHLNGAINCKLTSETPLLIAQSIEKGSPAKLQFYQENNQYIIPGSSIKGMLRSVIEAVTNSCFSIFDGTKLDYRHTTIVKKLKAGMIMSMPHNNNLGEIKLMERGWIAMCGKPTTVTGFQGGVPKTFNLAIVPASVKSGDEVWITYKKIEKYVTQRNKEIEGQFYLITDLCTSKKKEYVKAVYKITGKSIGNKKRERIFFCPRDDVRYKFGSQEEEDYNYIFEQQIDRWSKLDKSSKNYFDFKEQGKLKEHMLIYFEPEEGERRAKNISRVEVPRIRYEKSRQDLLPKAHHKCTDRNNLCAACKLFGYVEGENSMAGRISISDAKLVNSPLVASKAIPMKVLATPHPTSYNFYLRDPNNLTVVRNYNGCKIEDKKGKISESDVDDVELRGRKFYYHHPDKTDQSYYKVNPQHKIPESQHNSAMPLFKDNVFEFEVRFRNLSEFDLGLLLYCLFLEDDLRHKLGMGKPIGFGTVRIEIKSLFIDEVPIRKKYETFDFVLPDVKEKLQEYRDYFKNQVKVLTGRDFDSLRNIAAIKILLATTQMTKTHAYPSPEGYKWYMENRNNLLPDIDFIGNEKSINITGQQFNGGNYEKNEYVVSKTKPDKEKRFVVPNKDKGNIDAPVLEIGKEVKGVVISIKGLHGVVKLSSGEEVPFKRLTEYTPVEIGRKASFKIVKLTKDGKISHLEFRK
ncbi:MAG: TIGR03986 family CRISPR-associated RAMP protein [Candidatus Scalindua sp.]|nr:TIGR03986 family CRISPR-associated RAMP protein [Candidatus Scalindua sp.]